MFYFCSIFFQYLFQINEQYFSIATLAFRVSKQIFLMCYLKNHMTEFCDFWSKIFGNILKIFVISCSKIFKLIFLESPAENIENAAFYFIQICPCFVSSILFILWIIIFATKLRFVRNRLSPSLIKNKKKIIALKLAKFLSRPDQRIQFISFISCKKIFLTMCQNFGFFQIFWKF
jgi:hypothetical protein